GKPHSRTSAGTCRGELAAASDCGLEVGEGATPILLETRRLCDKLNLDPLGLIASGSLLMAVGPDDAQNILDALQNEGIDAAAVGRVVEDHARAVLLNGDTERPVPQFARDEITRLFE
ncbi:MAG: AIR synthase-related protein, partial [Anaerolineae bacterium]|nr:AIR synthase-related protein [Anaerolineae bacterium]